jgi:hypothetical protein
MACVSPPPSWVSDFVEPTSQQFRPVASGKIMMKPFASASDTKLDLVSLNVPGPVPWQW